MGTSQKGTPWQATIATVRFFALAFAKAQNDETNAKRKKGRFSKSHTTSKRTVPVSFLPPHPQKIVKDTLSFLK